MFRTTIWMSWLSGLNMSLIMMTGFGIRRPEFPTTASEVFKWWQVGNVQGSFPTISAFILEIIRLLPRSTENG